MKEIKELECMINENVIQDTKRRNMLMVLRTIERDLEEMREDTQFLRCLEAAGVDNWLGYEYAQEMMEEED